MNIEGPPLEVLTRRLVETPPDFLDEPRIGAHGRVAVPAVVNDVLARYGQRATAGELARWHGTKVSADRNRLALCLIAAWLLADESLLALASGHEQRVNVLDTACRELAAVTAAHAFVHDTDRREELARTVLARLGLRPAGETEAQAGDRLASISGTERQRLIAAARTAERRARAIREALAAKAAQESADKWTRE